MAGRQHVHDEIGKDYSGKVIAICIASRRGGILEYLHTMLDEYSRRLDAMGSGLEAGILKILKDISKMWV